MKNVTGGQLLGFVGFILLAGAAAMVNSIFGQREAFRFWGICLLGTSMVFTLMKCIPLQIGEGEPRMLEGWRKAYVLFPSYVIGLAVALFPHQIVCAINLKGYVCAA